MISEDISTQKWTAGIPQRIFYWWKNGRKHSRIARELCEKEGVVLDGERKAAGSKESCQSVNVNARIPQYHHTKSAVQPNQQYTLAELKKMKATELLVLLSQQGRVFNKRTRKQVSINAYLGGTSNIPRDNWKNLKTTQKFR